MPNKVHNEYIPFGDHTILEIAIRGREGVYQFVIDNDLVEIIKSKNWYFDPVAKRVYHIHNGKKTYLTRFIAEAKHIGSIHRINMKNVFDYRWNSIQVIEEPVHGVITSRGATRMDLKKVGKELTDG